MFKKRSLKKKNENFQKKNHVLKYIHKAIILWNWHTFWYHFCTSSVEEKKNKKHVLSEKSQKQKDTKKKRIKKIHPENLWEKDRLSIHIDIIFFTSSVEKKRIKNQLFFFIYKKIRKNWNSKFPKSLTEKKKK